VGLRPGCCEERRGAHQAGSSLANDSRQNLLAAYELATREAEARAKSRGPAGAVEAMRARILTSGKGGST
jgi:hypothetical protein